jgi:hypothetical protein
METSQGKLEIITSYFSDFSPEQLRQFGMLGELYTDWNAKINVISRKDIDALYEKHVLHALSIAACFPFPPGRTLLTSVREAVSREYPWPSFFRKSSSTSLTPLARKSRLLKGFGMPSDCAMSPPGMVGWKRSGTSASTSLSAGPLLR